ncbi:hypothetical protein NQ317_005677 [Molorchus minor]|uniref:AGC-kinase C-terminal domain-containing protein n=1 Tax=Molorchus minor TaxID=1323400 RepID=A0ABQ9J8N1_9CUCU|nr:hypothetical protein NQ317_005677 [Molorchus minor]
MITRSEFMKKILSGKIEWPRHLDPIAKDLVKKLLVQDRTKRLGNMKSGAEDIKRHRWFKGIDWHDVVIRKLIVMAFLKRKNECYIPKKVKVLTKEEVERFLLDSPDDHWQLEKIVTIFGIVGCCRSDELFSLTVNGIKDMGKYPPIVPKIMYEGDSSNFDEYPETDWKSSRTLEQSEMKLFEDF